MTVHTKTLQLSDFVDDNGVSNFVDDLDVVLWVDDNGLFLGDSSGPIDPGPEPEPPIDPGPGPTEENRLNPGVLRFGRPLFLLPDHW